MIITKLSNSLTWAVAFLFLKKSPIGLSYLKLFSFFDLLNVATYLNVFKIKSCNGI